MFDHRRCERCFHETARALSSKVTRNQIKLSSQCRFVVSTRHKVSYRNNKCLICFTNLFVCFSIELFALLLFTEQTEITLRAVTRTPKADNPRFFRCRCKLMFSRTEFPYFLHFVRDNSGSMAQKHSLIKIANCR